MPELVAKSRTSNGTLIVFGSNLYWWAIAPFSSGWPTAQTETHLYSAPSDGSAIASELTPHGPLATGYDSTEPNIAVGASKLYWIEEGTRIMSCPLQGCAGEPPEIAVGTPTRKQHLYLDEAGSYWLDSDVLDDSESVTAGSVRFCPGAGCTEGAEPAALTPGTVRKFQLDSRYLYWDAPQMQKNDPFVDQVIYRAPKPMASASP